MKALYAVALGAAAMYLLDPSQGKRRRARIRDRAGTMRHDVVERVGSGTRRLRDRVRGRARDLTTARATDAVIEQRLRARLGHFVRNSGLLDVKVEDGVANVRGQIIATDIDELLHRLRRVQGVRRLAHAFEVLPDVIPMEEGASGRRIARIDTAALDRDHPWTPAARLLVGGCGGLLVLDGLRRRNMRGFGLATLGMMTLSRAFVETTFVGEDDRKARLALHPETVAAVPH